MKKGVILLSLFLFLGLAGGLFAAESEFYAKTVYIEKVYPHQLGYKVLYMTSKLDLAATYIPHSWFGMSSSKGGEKVKGEIQWGNDPDFPYMIIFWKGGKFSHVRLFLKKSFNDLSFGTLNPGENIDEKFDVQDISLEF